MRLTMMRTGYVGIEFEKTEMKTDKKSDTHTITLSPGQIAQIISYYVRRWANHFGKMGNF